MAQKTSMRAVLSAPLLLAAVAVLTACGFHRQGMTPIPPVLKQVYLESGDTFTDFQRDLRSALSNAGATLVERREQAGATLRIINDETGRRVLSVSARNTPREYEIFYTVTYSVIVDGREALEPQTLSLTRDYSFNEEALLAKEAEEDVLRRALARDLVGIVMRRLSSL
jgi:LPS-assembly lipoprotein